MNENERYHREWSLPTWYPPLPNTQGGKLPDIPALWERAKEMLARALTQIPSARAIAARFRMSRKARREFREWIEPVERLARSCIIAKAAIFLMMTPEGRKLMRDTPKTDEPASKTIAASSRATHKLSIPHPGWHTIAQPWRPEQQQQQQQEQPPADPVDPSGWRAAFRTTRWIDDTAREAANGDKPKPAFNTADYLAAIDPYDIRPRDPAQKRDLGDYPCLDLARRIEALQRVLADPTAAIRRTARFLASFKADVLRLFDAGCSHPRWLHGAHENRQGRGHVYRSIAALANAIPPRPG
jgi:hypothetical protein